MHPRKGRGAQGTYQGRFYMVPRTHTETELIETTEIVDMSETTDIIDLAGVTECIERVGFKCCCHFAFFSHYTASHR